MANLKAFFVPANHLQLLLKSFNVSVDITYLYMLLASYYQTTCQVDWLYISLLNKLHISIKRFTKGLVDTACHHFWIDEVVEWRNATLQKVHLGKRNHIHCNFIQINVQVSFEAHATSQIVNYICNYTVFFFKVPFFLFLVSSL